jgi:hypothetical protein
VTEPTTLPVLSITDARDKTYQPGSAREAARALAYEAGEQHAIYAAGEAAAALHQLFGDGAERAVFDASDAGDGTDAELLVVFDRDDNVIWYNRDSGMNGCGMVEARDARTEPMPDVDRYTQMYIDDLVEWAEDAVQGGYLTSCDLLYEPSIGRFYDGSTVELNIPAEMTRLANLVKTTAGNGRPQRRLMTADERDLLTKALGFLIDNRGQMKRIVLGDEEHAVLVDLATVLAPR